MFKKGTHKKFVFRALINAVNVWRISPFFSLGQFGIAFFIQQIHFLFSFFFVLLFQQSKSKIKWWVVYSMHNLKAHKIIDKLWPHKMFGEKDFLKLMHVLREIHFLEILVFFLFNFQIFGYRILKRNYVFRIFLFFFFFCERRGLI